MAPSVTQLVMTSSRNVPTENSFWMPVEGPGDDALVVAEQQAGQHDDQAHGQQVDAGADRRPARPAPRRPGRRRALVRHRRPRRRPRRSVRSSSPPAVAHAYPDARRRQAPPHSTGRYAAAGPIAWHATARSHVGRIAGAPGPARLPAGRCPGRASGTVGRCPADRLPPPGSTRRLARAGRAPDVRRPATAGTSTGACASGAAACSSWPGRRPTCRRWPATASGSTPPTGWWAPRPARMVASALVGGKLKRLHSEVSLLAKVPALVSALAPASQLRPSQQRALDLFLTATDAEPATIQEIGHAALAATTPRPEVTRRNISLVLGTGPLAVRGPAHHLRRRLHRRAVRGRPARPRDHRPGPWRPAAPSPGCSPPSPSATAGAWTEG